MFIHHHPSGIRREATVPIGSHGQLADTDILAMLFQGEGKVNKYHSIGSG